MDIKTLYLEKDIQLQKKKKVTFLIKLQVSGIFLWVL